jgi:hypothetical protein
MSLGNPIPRNLDESSKILAGLTPVELAGCALIYAALNFILGDIPFSPAISLILAVGLGGALIVLNRNFPPGHGLLLILQIFRPSVLSVMPFGLEEENEK